MGSAATTEPLVSGSYTVAQTRVIEAAIELFGVHGISGTSLQMIADAIGVTKAAVYHQYKSKDDIVLAVARIVLARLETAVTAAESQRSRSRAREVLVGEMIDLAVEQRRMAGVLQRDPIMLRFLEEHGPFRRVMERVNRVLMGGATEKRRRVQAALFASAIAGGVIHPLVRGLDDANLRAEIRKQAQRLFPAR